MLEPRMHRIDERLAGADRGDCMDAEGRAMQGAIAESEAGDCMDAGGRTMQGVIVEVGVSRPTGT